MTVGHELLSFMNTYSGYNQISIYDLDQEHISFITNNSMYCYKVMSFGLIDGGATYQRLVNMMFKDQIEKIMEVDVDHMLVNSKYVRDHVKHLEGMFAVLRK